MRRGRLSGEERRRWREEGFFARLRVFSEAEIEALRDAAEAVVERAGRAAAAGGESYYIDGNHYHEAAGSTIQFEHSPDSDTIRVIEPFHHLDPCFDRLVDDPRLVEPMRDLVGANRISLFTDKMNLKRPREGSRFRWHQDSPYWGHFCAHLDRLPNVMLALDDASDRNGCFRVVAGSHTRGCLPGREGEGTLGPLFTDPAHFDPSRQVLLEVPAGSLIFFSPHTVHGSRPNRSDQKRRALVLTYQPAGHRMFKVDSEREAGAARDAA
jgi:ectoine hydroxylase-related dioxygenase (phytanoyl-CoA dioxygenase family)